MNISDNVYDIRKKDSLIYILPDKSIFKIRDKEIKKKTAIVINLFYIDTIDFYLEYINKVPEKIHVYIISSVLEVCAKVEEYKQNKPNIFVIKKKNRGRDVSALLVAFGKKALEYEYICFLHDKREHYAYLKKDVDHWINNLWGNTIGSVNYIENVLQIFEENPLIGLLVPPEPMGEYINSWCNDVWGDNYQNTKRLARKLNLNCQIVEDKQPITLGTAFWARTCCLEKLFKIEWRYIDFPEEPLNHDGTISHAIERIFGYVAQDAKYKTGTIMSTSYAEWKLLFLQDYMRNINTFLKDNFNIDSLYKTNPIYKNKIVQFFYCNEYVYIYGAGTYGRNMLQYLKILNLEPKGFVVSDGKRKNTIVDELQVYELQEIIDKKNMGIIISLNDNLQEQIIHNLIERKFFNFIKGNCID